MIILINVLIAIISFSIGYRMGIPQGKTLLEDQILESVENKPLNDKDTLLQCANDLDIILCGEAEDPKYIKIITLLNKWRREAYGIK